MSAIEPRRRTKGIISSGCTGRIVTWSNAAPKRLKRSIRTSPAATTIPII
jgi:hypothetical protein